MSMTMFILLLIRISSLISCVLTKSVVIARKNSKNSMPTLPFPNSVFQHKIRGNQTDKTFVLFEAEYLTEGPGYHIHMNDDELFHILEGQVQFIVNNTQFCASTGDYVFVPRSISQGIRVYNPTNMTRPVKIQIMLFPSGLENFLDEIVPLYEHDQQNRTAIAHISEKYGIIDQGPVQWKELGCFDNVASRKASTIAIVMFLNLLKHLLQ